MNCSGRGFIGDDGNCECIDGWTSYGDLRASVGVDCDVSTVFVRVVYAVPLVLFALAFRHSLLEIMTFIENRGWRRVCKFSNKVFVIHASTIISSVILSALCIQKVIAPEHAIGVNPSVTWTFFLGMTTFLVIAGSSFELFVRMSIRQEKFGGSKAIVRLLKFSKYLVVILLASAVSSFSLVLGALYSREVSIALADSLIMCFWIILGATALMLLVMTPLTLHSTCRDLDAMVGRHKSDGSASEIARFSAKLKRIRIQAIVRGTINSTCFFLMGIYSQARYWSPYVIGLQALFISILIVSASYLTATKRHGSSSTQNSKTMPVVSKTPRTESKIEHGSKTDSKEEPMVSLADCPSPTSKKGMTMVAHGFL